MELWHPNSPLWRGAQRAGGQYAAPLRMGMTLKKQVLLPCFPSYSIDIFTPKAYHKFKRNTPCFPRSRQGRHRDAFPRYNENIMEGTVWQILRKT